MHDGYIHPVTAMRRLGVMLIVLESKTPAFARRSL